MKRLHVALLCLSVAPLASAAPPPDVTLTWIEKYLTYAQDRENRLTHTNRSMPKQAA
jgi:hypothetical protein